MAADAMNLDAHVESYDRLMGGYLEELLVRTAAVHGVAVSNVTISLPRKTPIDTQRDRGTYAISVHADVCFPDPRCVCVRVRCGGSRVAVALLPSVRRDRIHSISYASLAGSVTRPSRSRRPSSGCSR
jgi:hypothetical protein